MTREQETNDDALMALAQEVVSEINSRGVDTAYEWCLVLVNRLSPHLDKMIKEEREACINAVKKEIELWDRESVVELRESILIEISARSS